MTTSQDSESRRHLGTKQGARSLDQPHPVVIPIIEVLTRLPPTRDREFQTIVVPGIPGTSASKLYICLGDASNPPVYDWIEYIATGAGGPSDATYLVGAAHSGLSAEIVVGATPGGELGNTWASPTVDPTHSGTSHAGVVATHEGLADPHTVYVLEAATPGGELGNTYAAPTVDAVHSGSSHAGVLNTLTVRAGSGAPAGAPTGTELPLAVDTDAVTGGVYYWTGAAWVQAATI